MQKIEADAALPRGWGVLVNSYRFARGKVSGELINEGEVKPCSLCLLGSVIPIIFGLHFSLFYSVSACVFSWRGGGGGSISGTYDEECLSFCR